MKKYIIFVLALFMTVACNNKNQASISVNIDNFPDSSVILYKLNYNYFASVDTIKTDSKGHFDYKVEMQNQNPAFYYLYTIDNSQQLAAMILLPKDKVTINTNLKGDFTIEGSEESLNLQKIDMALKETNTKIAKIIAEDPEDANTQVTRLYVEHKRNMLRHIAGNPHSITSATVTFQDFYGQIPVFGEPSDIVIFKSIYDSLKTVYPNSEYLVGLMDEIEGRKNSFTLSNSALEASFVGFPELSLPDMNGQQVVLSKVVAQNKVTVILFWSVSMSEHKMFNLDLIDLYEKYHDNGFEVYQISIDDKPTWASAVKAQQLPWINVNDGLGLNSQSLKNYNISEIPTMYVIASDGDVTDKDVYDMDELEKIIRKNGIR